MPFSVLQQKVQWEEKSFVLFRLEKKNQIFMIAGSCEKMLFNKVLNFIKTRSGVPLSSSRKPCSASVVDGIKEQRESWD